MKLCTKLKTRASLLFSCFKKWLAVIFFIVSSALLFIPLDDLGINTIFYKILCLCAAVLICLIAAIIETIARRKRTIWSSGSRFLSAEYGDIFELAEKKARDGGAFCVIPVNSTFDTLVDEPGSCSKPLVSPRTIHGTWVNKMLDSGISIDALNSKIAAGLDDAKPVGEISQDIKSRGNLSEYAIGTTSILKWNEVTYLLVALSSFDEDNKASSNNSNLELSLTRVLDRYDRDGQGCGLYIPLMGTANSRMGMTHKESFDITAASVTLRERNLNGGATIVVYEGDSEKISIWNS